MRVPLTRGLASEPLTRSQHCLPSKSPGASVGGQLVSAPRMGFSWPSPPATSCSQSQPPTWRKRTDSDRKLQKASDLFPAAWGKGKTLETRAELELRSLGIPQVQKKSLSKPSSGDCTCHACKAQVVEAGAAEAMTSFLQEPGPGNQGRISAKCAQQSVLQGPR